MCDDLVAGGGSVTAVQWQRMHRRVLAALPRISRAEHAVEKLAEMIDAKLQTGGVVVAQDDDPLDVAPEIGVDNDLA